MKPVFSVMRKKKVVQDQNIEKKKQKPAKPDLHS